MNERKKRAAVLSVISNSFLIILKIIVGLITGSISVISEALHSFIDLLASLIAYLAIKKSSLPPDTTHHYGHHKIENISGFIEAILIFIAAGWIIIESIKKLISPQPLQMMALAIGVMLFSTVVNLFVSRFLLRIANQTSSIALKADAIHLLSDVYTSLGVVIGLLLIWMLQRLFPPYHFYWIDPLTAIGVAGVIIKSAIKLTKESIEDLIDTAASEAEIKQISEIIKNFDKNILGFKNLKTRKSGATIFIEFDLILNKNISFEYAHTITDLLQKEIKSQLTSEVIIHAEPSKEEKIS